MSYLVRANNIPNGIRIFHKSMATTTLTNALAIDRRYYTQRNGTIEDQRLLQRTIQHQPQLKTPFSTVNETKLEKPAVKSVIKRNWDRAISEAEKIVGYPTSFLSLRWLLSDEVAHVAMHLRRLVGTNHPLLKTAKNAATQVVGLSENDRNFLYQGRNPVQTWGLVVMLLSKAAGHSPTVPEAEKDKDSGVLHTQRALAEITEMIRISHLVHQGMVNLQPITQSGQDQSQYANLTFGNKICLLSGDYLLGNSCAELSSLRNQDLVAMISSVIRDHAESDFIGDRDEQNNPLPTEPGKRPPNALTFEEMEQEIDQFSGGDVLKPIPKDRFMASAHGEWILRNFLSSGSLLGRGCQGSLVLAQLSKHAQRNAFRLGLHISLAWQACHDLDPFETRSWREGDSFSLVSAPVLLHLEFDPTLYNEIKKGYVHVDNVDYERIHQKIINGPAVELTHHLLRRHILAALQILNKYPNTDARAALQNIIMAMQEI